MKYLGNKKILLILLYVFSFSFIFSNIIEYYESNKYGFALREIHPSRLQDFEYVLIYENRGSIETRRLLEKNKEIARWERRNRFSGTYVETQYKNNEIVLVVHYSGGRLVKEEIYFEGSVSEIREYSYRSNNLLETILYNAKGTHLFTYRYSRDGRGRLTSVVKLQKDEEGNFIEVASFSFQYSDHFLSMQIFIEGDEVLKFIYTKGRLHTVEETKGGELVYRKEFPLDKDIATETDFVKKENTNRVYDKEGRVVKEIVVNENGEKSQIFFTYNEDGLLIERKVRAPKIRELFTYEYDSEGQLVLVEYFLNSKIMWRREYSNLRDYEESIFKDGDVVYKALFSDGQFVKALEIGVEN
ncbi:MAG: hypothetical protein JXR63_13705 [Spirochaetales bacterium]|nr:hypothetical protein [Spirochaetales bacterium]